MSYVAKVGYSTNKTPDLIDTLEENFHLVPQHRKERVACLVVAYKRGDEYDARDLAYALETAAIVEKRINR